MDYEAPLMPCGCILLPPVCASRALRGRARPEPQERARSSWQCWGSRQATAEELGCRAGKPRGGWEASGAWSSLRAAGGGGGDSYRPRPLAG